MALIVVENTQFSSLKIDLKFRHPVTALFNEPGLMALNKLNDFSYLFVVQFKFVSAKGAAFGMAAERLKFRIQSNHLLKVRFSMILGKKYHISPTLPNLCKSTSIFTNAPKSGFIFNTHNCSGSLRWIFYLSQGLWREILALAAGA